MYVCKLVYDLLWYQVPFVGLVSIYLLHILFGSDSSFNYTTDCAGVVAFQSLLMANPFLTAMMIVFIAAWLLYISLKDGGM